MRRGGAGRRVGLLRVPRRHARARVGLRPRHLHVRRGVRGAPRPRVPGRLVGRVRSKTKLDSCRGARGLVGGPSGSRRRAPLATSGDAGFMSAAGAGRRARGSATSHHDAAFCKSSRAERVFGDLHPDACAPEPCGWALAPSGSADTTPSRNALHLGQSNREQAAVRPPSTRRDRASCTQTQATRGGCCPTKSSSISPAAHELKRRSGTHRAYTLAENGEPPGGHQGGHRSGR